MAEDWQYVRRIAVAIGLISLASIIWIIRDIVLLIFASILIAILLDSGGRSLADRSPLSREWALVVVVLALAALFGGAVTMFGAQLSRQLLQVMERLPTALDEAGGRLGIENLAGRLNESITSAATQRMALQAAGFGYTVIGAIGYLLLVFIAAIYLAAAPVVYHTGLMRLLPRARQARVEETMLLIAHSLRLWFGAQILAMLLVGTAGTMAFWWIGLPSPVALGIIFGVANFVPYAGPIIGSIPALVFAATQGLTPVLWTAGAVLLIQHLEGYVITPLLQQQAVQMPPALALFAIVTAGTIFGFLGVVLAVPLVVAAMVMVQELWVEDALQERTSGT